MSSQLSRFWPFAAVFALFLVVVLMVPVIPAQAAETICADPNVFFCDNFEDRAVGSGDLQSVKSAKTTGWALSEFDSMVVATNDAFDGTKSLRFDYKACTWLDGQNDTCGAGFMGSHNFSVNAYYMRHYSKFASNFVWSPIATKHLALETLTPGRRPWLYAGGPGTYGSAEFALEDEPDFNRLYLQNQGQNLAFNLNQWYCIEMHVVRNTPGSALVEMWVDDILRLRYTDANFGTDNWNEVLLSGYWNTSNSPGSHDAFSKWYDNFVFSTARIGCLGSTPPPAPPPPSTKFSLNDRVQVVNGTLNVRSTPSTSGTLLGSQAVGALGTVIGGPTASGGFNWWNINYDSGVDGWSVEDNLQKIAVTPPPSLTPGTVSNLSVPSVTSNSATLSFTEVNDGTGLPAKYDVRYAQGTINWGSAASVTSGTCSTPLQGTSIGATKTCTVTGLSANTSYQFQLVSFRGTLNVDAVFGGTSNIASGVTSQSSSLPGDLNADSLVNALDLQLEVNVILGTETNTTIKARADLNGDGQANALDLQMLVNKVLGL